MTAEETWEEAQVTADDERDERTVARGVVGHVVMDLTESLIAHDLPANDSAARVAALAAHGARTTPNLSLFVKVVEDSGGAGPTGGVYALVGLPADGADGADSADPLAVNATFYSETVEALRASVGALCAALALQQHLGALVATSGATSGATSASDTSATTSAPRVGWRAVEHYEAHPPTVEDCGVTLFAHCGACVVYNERADRDALLDAVSRFAASIPLIWRAPVPGALDPDGEPDEGGFDCNFLVSLYSARDVVSLTFTTPVPLAD